MTSITTSINNMDIEINHGSFVYTQTPDTESYTEWADLTPEQAKKVEQITFKMARAYESCLIELGQVVNAGDGQALKSRVDSC
jgi:hypothetical protein